MSARFFLPDGTCYHSPAGEGLEVSLVGSMAFLRIVKNDEKVVTTETTYLAEICVDARSLIAALEALNTEVHARVENRKVFEDKGCCQDGDEP